MSAVASSSVNARILYWGIAGSGKTTNLEAIRGKLRPDHRGDIEQQPTRIDPTVCYELLPIQLGDVGGVATRIEIISVPAGNEQAPTRKQLLDEVSGVVLVVDASPERADENVAARDELEASLSAYGRSLAEIPLVVQYNKRDLADAYAVESLHKRLALPAAAVFEAVASEGTGVLQTLTTISKRVVRLMRDAGAATARHHAAPATPAVATATSTGAPGPIETQASGRTQAPGAADRSVATQASAGGGKRLLEDAIEADLQENGDEAASDPLELDARTAFDASFDELSRASKPDGGLRIGPDLRIVSVGSVRREGERTLRVPLVLGDSEGATATLALTLQLDPMLDDEDGAP